MEISCGLRKRCVVFDGSWVTPDLQCLVNMLEAPAFSKPVHIFFFVVFLRNLLLQLGHLVSHAYMGGESWSSYLVKCYLQQRFPALGCFSALQLFQLPPRELHNSHR